jgi:hypothetical protein
MKTSDCLAGELARRVKRRYLQSEHRETAGKDSRLNIFTSSYPEGPGQLGAQARCSAYLNMTVARA